MSRPSRLTYVPAWWVPGPHAQTLWGRVRKTRMVTTRSERWTTPDDDDLELHRLDATSSNAPRLVLLHGLEGTIRSHYLQGTLRQAQLLGWAADVMIFRGCNGETNRARRMYHSGETTDVDFVVRRLASLNPDQPLLLAGFSLGGNVLLKWLGEQGTSVPSQVCAAAAVSVPFDLELGSRNIEHGFSRLYGWHFLRSLRLKAMRKLTVFPDAFSAEALRNARTLYDFDDVVTAPVHGFDNAHDYYSRSSSRHFIAGIGVPTLLLTASDDPFIPRQVLDDVGRMSLHNRNISVETWNYGGHVGFVSGRNPLRPRFYAEERVIEFLADHVERNAHAVR